jgi:tetratricopeptide (TPR) repeat protein
VLAEVYALTQFFVAYQPAADLLWRVAERATTAAFDSGDLRAIGMTAWLLGQAHRDAGDWDAADIVTTQASTLLGERLDNDVSGHELAALYGALVFETGYTAARRGESGNAWRHWDEADEIAQRLPVDYFHPITSFSRAVMHAHAVTVAVELRQGGEGVRQAQRSNSTTIPSNPRQARHWIEEARAYRLEGLHTAAFAALDSAFASAPETIRYNGFAREIILDELDSPHVRRRERASKLARDIGLLNA